MAFNNPRNRCSLTGYVYTDIQKVPDSSSIEFGIVVERTSEVKGKKTYSDSFTVYVASKSTVDFVTTNIRKGIVVTVKGEMRIWFDKTPKLCADTITLKG